MSAGSRFHSCGDEMEKPRRPERSLRKRGTRSWTCVADRKLRLAGISFDRVTELGQVWLGLDPRDNFL